MASLQTETHAETLLRDAQSLLDNAQFEGAIHLLEESLDIDPLNMKTLETLGVAQVAVDLIDDATGTYEKLIASGSLKTNSLLGWANTLSEFGRNVQVLEVLDVVLLNEPDNIEAILMSAQLYEHMGNWPEAERKFKRILEINPNHDIARSILGYPPEPNIPFAFLRSYLRAIANVFPIFKRIALSVMEREIRRRAKKRVDTDISKLSDWLSYGRELWLAHPAYHGNQTLILETPGAKLPISDRLAEAARVSREMPEDMKAANEVLCNEIKQWALQVAALEDANGYWHSVITAEVYSRRKYNMRNHALFSEYYGIRDVYPKSIEAIPAEFGHAFTMDGRVEIETGYLDQSYPGDYVDLFNDVDFDRYDAVQDAAGEAEVGPKLRFMRRWYCSTNGKVDTYLMEKLPDLLAKGKTAGVFGATNLYLEAACLRHGASETTTVRYVPFKNNSTKIRGLMLSDWDMSPTSYDLVLAINTVDPFGLGMHGEPIDPDADISLMRRFRKMVRQGGNLVISVPIGKDRIVFNTARIYGKHRLPLLLQGWDIIESVDYDPANLEDNSLNRSLLVLQPTQEVQK